MEFYLRPHTGMTVNLLQFRIIVSNMASMPTGLATLAITVTLQTIPVRAFTRFDIVTLCGHLFMILIETMAQVVVILE